MSSDVYLRQVLLSSTQHIDKGHEYEMMKPWLKEGLLTSSGTIQLRSNTGYGQKSLFKILLDIFQSFFIIRSLIPYIVIDSRNTLCFLDVSQIVAVFYDLYDTPTMLGYANCSFKAQYKNKFFSQFNYVIFQIRTFLGGFYCFLCIVLMLQTHFWSDHIIFIFFRNSLRHISMILAVVKIIYSYKR